ncbi:BTAD domain-containing putative transcriptional regulator [Kitasatospora sp. A2-31]|uniref:AfsR/SARP family transcriptional regulator n=1 Tax=Kitasatospora sp. A2-31 TaxID=2916414 RepID=UPI001EE8A765|nr:BTAD domain-containing putative transcriptional regulator [Kitasatospora sp. A2-31]MCG6493289.1 winged helix-turn-helix domain-containing protein [Kitasatospora sp. A2-31]
MHYGILGTTTAHHDDGTPVPLGGARLRALLAALVLRQGRPVAADLLVDEVWDAEPPQDAPAALQTLVGRLRRTIGRDQVGSGPAGYWLTEPHTDLGEFQRLAGEGRRALEEGDHGPAAERLRAALALWRGPVLADLPDRSGPATRLETQREEVRRHRILADLGLGRAAELVAELAELCARQPLDESVQYLMVRALHESGRTAEALRHYERTRRTLAEELGVDPGRRLRTLYAELLAPADHPPADRPAPAPAPVAAAATAPGPAAPPTTPSATTPSAGTSSAGTPSATAPQPPRSAGNLRTRLTSFVGREGDLAALRGALTRSRLVTLTGPGGSGKTRLSVEAGRAEQAAGHWPDGVWLAELAPLESPAAVPAAVVSALGLRETVLHTGGMVAEVIEPRSEDPLRRLVEYCGHRRMLLVLDNCEHLIQAAADLADRLLAECPGLTVLATSREPLGVPGETVLPVEPLPDPVALRLLAERAAAARPGFDPQREPEACAEICRRLDGLPLAIELAAARLRVMTARQIADRLDGRFALLTGGSRTLLPRQQTLRAVVDWSWELLGKRERAVLRRLSVFAGGWTLEDAEAICADDVEVPREEVADQLLSLADKSLVVADLSGDGSSRYRMLETIHEYAEERLAEAAERAEVERRHLVHFRELVRTADQHVHGPEQLRWLAVLEREHDNIRAALRRAVEREEEQEGLALALGMSWYWSLRGFSLEARGWYDAVRALGPDPFDPAGPPAEPLERQVLEYGVPMPPGVAAEARRQLEIFRLVGLFEGNLDVLADREAIRVSQQLLEAYTPDLPQSYRFPGVMRVFAAFLAGRLDVMRDLMEEAVAGSRRHGRAADLAFVLQIRAKTMNDWPGGLEQALRDGEESLELYRRIGDRWGMSQAYAAHGEALAGQGRSAEAVAAYQRAIELAEELDAPQEVPMLRVHLGSAMLEQDLDAGERYIREALDTIDPGKIQAADGALLFGRLMLCGISAHRGAYDEALAELDRVNWASRIGTFAPDLVGGMLTVTRGWIVAQAGDPERGLAILDEGRRLLRAVPPEGSGFAEQLSVMLVPPAAGVLRIFAERDHDLVAGRKAAVLLGAHTELNGPKGGYLDRLERAASEASLRALLGDEAFEAAHAEGAGLSLPQTSSLLDDLMA